MTAKVRIEYVALRRIGQPGGDGVGQPDALYGVDELAANGGSTSVAAPVPNFGTFNGVAITTGVARIIGVYGAAVVAAGASPVPSELSGFRIVTGDEPIEISVQSGWRIAMIESADAPAGPGGSVVSDAAAEGSLATLVVTEGYEKTDLDTLVANGQDAAAGAHTDAMVIKADLDQLVADEDSNAVAAHTDATALRADLDAANVTAGQVKADLDTANATAVQIKADLDAANTAAAAEKADLDSLVAQAAGSIGTDYSTNKPAIPNVGQPFGNDAGDPYAGYVLLETIPASPTRGVPYIMNTAGVQIAIVTDDGTAALGQPPANAGVFALAPGATPGAQGGTTDPQLKNFKGRIQIYGPTGSEKVYAQVW